MFRESKIRCDYFLTPVLIYYHVPVSVGNLYLNTVYEAPGWRVEVEIETADVD